MRLTVKATVVRVRRRFREDHFFVSGFCRLPGLWKIKCRASIPSFLVSFLSFFLRQMRKRRRDCLRITSGTHARVPGSETPNRCRAKPRSRCANTWCATPGTSRAWTRRPGLVTSAVGRCPVETPRSRRFVAPAAPGSTLRTAVTGWKKRGTRTWGICVPRYDKTRHDTNDGSPKTVGPLQRHHVAQERAIYDNTPGGTLAFFSRRFRAC